MRSETVGNAFPFLTHNPGMPAGFPLGFTATGHELVLFDPAEPIAAQQPDEYRGQQRVRQDHAGAEAEPAHGAVRADG